MFEYHTTRNGEKMMICQMDDGHLYNFINLVCARIEQVRAASQVNAPQEMSDLDRALYDVRSVEPSDAASLIKEGMAMLYPYLAEVILRPNIYAGVQTRLSRALGRIEAVQKTGGIARLPAGYSHRDYGFGDGFEED